MSSVSNEQMLKLVEYEKYHKLVSQLYGQSLEMYVACQGGQIIWASDSGSKTVEEVCKSRLVEPCDHSGPYIDEDVNGIWVGMQDLCNNGSRVAIVAIYPSVTNGSPDLPDGNLVKEILLLVREHILNEYELVKDLNLLTEELGERYEELNFAFGECTVNPAIGEPGLKCLLQNCMQYLTVDYALLAIPKNRIFLYEENEKSDKTAAQLLELVKTAVYENVKESGKPLVVNVPGLSGEDEPELDRAHRWLAAPIVRADGGIIGVIALVRESWQKGFSNSDKNLCNIMARRAAKTYQSLFDDLTSVFRRTVFEKKIEFIAKNVVPLPEECCLLAINIQRMHVINENYGLTVGDAVIKSLVKQLRSILRHQDDLGRLGGDVFGIIVRHCDAHQAIALGEKIINTVKSHQVDFGDTTLSLNIDISVGIVKLDGQGDTRHIINCAETALELAAAHGSNRIEVYEEKSARVKNHEEDAARVLQVQKALSDDDFVLFCQGIFDIDNLEVPSHYEILLRMKGKGGDIYAPGTFLPAAQNYRLMSSIDTWVLNNALKTLSEWQHIHGETSCSWAINLSGQTLSSPDFSEQLKTLLKRYNFSPKKISFEVTEGETIDDIEQTSKDISALRSMGCEVYLDDFGTGLSSFSYLQKIPFDCVKIDGSFIRKIESDSVSRSMVAAICSVAKEIGLNIVAEFVEHQDMVPTLRELGVTHIQGYGVHQPEALTDVLNNRLHAKIESPAKKMGGSHG